MTKKKIEGILKHLYDLGNIGYKVTLQKYEKDKPIIQATQQIKELIIKEFEGWDFGYREGHEEFQEKINKL